MQRIGKGIMMFAVSLGAACVTDEVHEARLRWYGHAQRREDDNCAMGILEANVCGRRSVRRQRKRWIDIIKYDLEKLTTHVSGCRGSC